MIDAITGKHIYNLSDYQADDDSMSDDDYEELEYRVIEITNELIAQAQGNVK